MRALDDPTSFSVLTEIRAIDQLIAARLTRALPDDLELSHFAILNHFSNLGGEKNPAQLARVFQLTKGAITNSIARLEKKGLVRVRPDPNDGRKKFISLTEAGLETRNRAIDALAPEFGAITEGVGRERLREALPALRDLRLFLASAEGRAAAPARKGD